MQTFTFKLVHGVELKADVYAPGDEGGSPRKTLLVPSQMVIIPGASHGLRGGGDPKAIDSAFDAAFRSVDERL